MDTGLIDSYLPMSIVVLSKIYFAAIGHSGPAVACQQCLKMPTTAHRPSGLSRHEQVRQGNLNRVASFKKFYLSSMLSDVFHKIVHNHREWRFIYPKRPEI